MKIINQIKQKVKDEYMLYIYHKKGGLDSMKKESKRFDSTFLSIQMRIIILIVSVAIAILSYYLLDSRGFPWWASTLVTLLVTWIVRRSLLFIAEALKVLTEYDDEYR